MRQLGTNPIVQLAAVSVAVMAVLAVAVSVALTARLDRNIELLNEYDGAAASGTTVRPEEPFSIESLRSELDSLRTLTYAAVGGGFAVLNAGLVVIAWLAWRGIGRHEAESESAKASIEDSAAGVTRSP